jgi:peptidoglycan/xylan/chitin deacetylase (PgdA/CDA1 family)
MADLERGIKDQNVPANTVAITFDDGFSSNYSEMFPIIKKREIPITIYLVSDIVGTSDEFWFVKKENILKKIEEEKLAVEFPPNEFFLKSSRTDLNTKIDKLAKKTKYKPGSRSALNWDEVQAMNDSEFVEIGSHTQTHPYLINLNKKTAEQEIILSKKTIEKKLKNKIKHFAYPSGMYDEIHTRIAKEAGYTTAVTAYPGVNTAKTNPLLLYRIAPGPVDTIPVFAVRTSGLWHKLNKVQFDWDNAGRKKNLEPI